MLALPARRCLALAAAATVAAALPACRTNTLFVDGGTADLRRPGASADLSPGDLNPGATDGAARDLSAADLAADLAGTDGPATAYPPELPGIWLIGWAGGLNHFTWVRFRPTSPWGGEVDLLDPDAINAAWIGLWPCEGAGQFTAAARPGTVQVRMPAACMTGDITLTFSAFRPPMGWPAGGDLEATIDVAPPGQPVNGYRYPASQCNATFTRCTLPQ